MKKLLLVLTTFFFAVSLTGCFLEPDDIEELSEQYCRDNPSSEICQGEIIDDLQDEAVINVFNTILDEYTDMENTTFCEDYFSITNVTLLDECRASRAFLFPEDIEGYQVESVEKEDTLSTQSVYTITVTKDDNPTTYMFTVSLVKVDGTMYIDEWTYVENTDEDPNPNDGVVTFEVAKAYFEQFVSDYVNNSITSDVLCDTYFPPEDKEGCKEDRDKSLADGITITNLEFFVEGNGFKATFTVNSNTEDPEDETLLLEFWYELDGTLKMKFENGEQNNQADFFKIYEDIINGFLTTTDPNTYCNQVMVPAQVANCIEGHQEMVQDNYTIEVYAFEPYNQDFKVKLRILYNDGTDEFIEMIIIFVENGDNWLIDQQELIDPIIADIEQLFTDFVAAFKDLSISDDAVCDTYFAPEDSQGCKDRRTEFRDNGETLELGYLYVHDDMTFEVEFIFNNNGVESRDEIKGHVEYGQYGILIIRFSDNQGGEDFHQFIIDLVFDFNDHGLSDDDVCDKYFYPEDADDCKERRNQARINNETIELVLFEHIPDQGFKVEFKFTGDNGEYIEVVYPIFFYNDNGELKVKFEDNMYCHIEWDNAQSFLDDFVAKFNDFNNDTSYLASMFMHPDTEVEFKNWRNDAIANGKTISYYWLYEEYGKYSFEFEMTDGSRVRFDVDWICHNEGYIVNLYYNNNNNNYSYDDGMQFISGVIAHVTTASNAIDVCTTHFDPMNQALCNQLLGEVFSYGYVITLDVLYQEDNHFRAVIKYTGTDGTNFTQDWLFKLYEENGMFYGELFHEGDGFTYDEKNNAINNFIDAFNSTDVDDQEVCSRHLTMDSVPLCISLRQEVLPNGFHIWTYFYEIEMHPYRLELGVYSNDNSIIDFLLHYDVEFERDTNGTVQVRLMNEYRYRHVRTSDAEAAIDAMLAELNDESYSNDDFCNKWGHLFDDCYATRESVNSINITAVRTYLYGMDDDTHYEMHLDLVFDDGTVNETLRFKLIVLQYLDGSIDIMGHQIIEHQPPKFDAFSVLESFFIDYFNTSLTEQDIYDRLNDGYMIHGLFMRDEILEDNWNWRIISVTEMNDYGYPIYIAVLGFSRNAEPEFEVSLEFDIYHNMNNEPVVSFIFPYTDPVMADLLAFATEFVADMNGDTLTHAEFCEKYVNDWDTWTCYEVLEQQYLSGYTLQLGEVIITDDGIAYFYLEFIDTDGSLISTFRIDTFQEYDIFNNVHYQAMFTGGDQALLNEAFDYIHAYVYAFNTHGLNLTTFCTEFAVCHDAFDDLTSQLHEVNYYDIYYDFKDIFNLTIRFDLEFEYMDGRMLYHNYILDYTLEDDGSYSFMFVFQGERVIIPTTAVAIPLAEAELVLDQFIIDILDPSITSEALCDMYFGGFMMSVGECVEGRADMLAGPATITKTPLTSIIDDGTTYYLTTFTITIGTEIEGHDAKLLVFQVPGETTYIIAFD